MENLHRLAQSTIFKDIPPSVIADICSHGRELSFDAQHLLFARGQEAHELMILHEGVVELFVPVHIMGATRDLTLERKQAGDLLAWSALVSPYLFTLSGRCVDRCTVTSLSRNVLLGCFQADPRVGFLFMKNLAGVIGRRLNNMHDIWLDDLQTAVIKRLE